MLFLADLLASDCSDSIVLLDFATSACLFLVEPNERPLFGSIGCSTDVFFELFGLALMHLALFLNNIFLCDDQKKKMLISVVWYSDFYKKIMFISAVLFI